MSSIRAAHLGFGALPLMWTTCLMSPLGVVSKTDNADTERLVQLEVTLLRTLHVHIEDRVVVKLQMCVNLVLLAWVSFGVSFEAAQYAPSLFDGCFVRCEADVHRALSHRLLRSSSPKRNTAELWLVNAPGLP